MKNTDSMNLQINTTVVIPNYNGKKYIGACMDSLDKCKPHKTIIVDNGSTDESEKGLEKHTDTCVIKLSENTGFCHAVNLGISEATTKYVLLLNNDTIVTPECIEILEHFLDKHPKAFCVSARLMQIIDKTLIDDAGDLYCALGWAFALGKDKKEDNYNKPAKVFAACGGAVLLRRELAITLGLFDEAHFAYLEDIDLGYRARLAGFENWVCPEAIVYHAGSATSGSRYNTWKTGLAAENSIYIIWKNMPVLQLILNLPLLLIGFLIKMAFFWLKSIKNKSDRGLFQAYVKGLGCGFKKCRAIENKTKKVHFNAKNLKNYIFIQLELWINTVRRFVG